MKVNHSHIVERGLKCKCPNCGNGSLFQGLFRLREKCPSCGLTLERGEGFFLGSMSINYGVTLIFFLTPLALLWYFEVLSSTTSIILAVLGSILFPMLFYRWSRSLWLMAYFLVLPHELPANQRSDIPVDEV